MAIIAMLSGLNYDQIKQSFEQMFYLRFLEGSFEFLCFLAVGLGHSGLNLFFFENGYRFSL